LAAEGFSRNREAFFKAGPMDETTGLFGTRTPISSGLQKNDER
jgi:hypothetical protein